MLQIDLLMQRGREAILDLIQQVFGFSLVYFETL